MWRGLGTANLCKSAMAQRGIKMKRQEFITLPGTATALPLNACGQQSARRVGVLLAAYTETDAAAQTRIKALFSALQPLGFRSHLWPTPRRLTRGCAPFLVDLLPTVAKNKSVVISTLERLPTKSSGKRLPGYPTCRWGRSSSRRSIARPCQGSHDGHPGLLEHPKSLIRVLACSQSPGPLQTARTWRPHDKLKLGDDRRP